MTPVVRPHDGEWVTKSSPFLQWILVGSILSVGILFITSLWSVPKDNDTFEQTCFILGWLLIGVGIIGGSCIETSTVTVDQEFGLILIESRSLSKFKLDMIALKDIQEMSLENHGQDQMLVRYYIEITSVSGEKYKVFDGAFDDAVDAHKMSSKLNRLQRIVQSHAQRSKLI